MQFPRGCKSGGCQVVVGKVDFQCIFNLPLKLFGSLGGRVKYILYVYTKFLPVQFEQAYKKIRIPFL